MVLIVSNLSISFAMMYLNFLSTSFSDLEFKVRVTCANFRKNCRYKYQGPRTARTSVFVRGVTILPVHIHVHDATETGGKLRQFLDVFDSVLQRRLKISIYLLIPLVQGLVESAVVQSVGPTNPTTLLKVECRNPGSG